VDQSRLFAPEFSEMVIRTADPSDLESVRALYAHYVRTSTATFDETPPGLDMLAARRARLIGLGLPFLVAEVDGRVAGFAYAAPYRTRVAYRFTVEDSVYVAPDSQGRGHGGALLGRLIDLCEQGPWRQMIAVVGDSANQASIALHRKHGFSEVGLLRDVGFKFGRWLDTPILQRALAGRGSSRSSADSPF
jgi:phosphinothricin acetyltransferase